MLANGPRSGPDDLWRGTAESRAARERLRNRQSCSRPGAARGRGLHHLRQLDGRPRRRRDAADHVHELVRVVRVLHLGRPGSYRPKPSGSTPSRVETSSACTRGVPPRRARTTSTRSSLAGRRVPHQAQPVPFVLEPPGRVVRRRNVPRRLRRRRALRPLAVGVRGTGGAVLRWGPWRQLLHR